MRHYSVTLITILFCALAACETSDNSADAGADFQEDTSQNTSTDAANKNDVDSTDIGKTGDMNSVADVGMDTTKATEDVGADVSLDVTPDLPATEGFTDNFSGTGDLIDYVTNNPTALPKVGRVDGRYRAELTDNQGNVTLHFNGDQGRLDAKLVSFPFEFIARNIGIGTLADSQVAPTDNGSPFSFAGVQIHVEDFNSINSSHVVVGHRGGTGFTIEGKNTLNGRSSVNDIGGNTAPHGRADIRIVGGEDRTLTVYWQLPNTDFENTADNWNTYRTDGRLPGTAPTYGERVYIGLITYAYNTRGVPFVGTCDAIQIK